MSQVLVLQTFTPPGVRERVFEGQVIEMPDSVIDDLWERHGQGPEKLFRVLTGQRAETVPSPLPVDAVIPAAKPAAPAAKPTAPADDSGGKAKK